jgi:hypothetical protein
MIRSETLIFANIQQHPNLCSLSRVLEEQRNRLVQYFDLSMLSFHACSYRLVYSKTNCTRNKLMPANLKIHPTGETT